MSFVHPAPLLTPDQCREARRLLGLSQSAVARSVGLAPTALGKFETTGYLPATEPGFPDGMAELRAMFEEAGVEFTNGEQPRVQLRKATGDK